MYKNNAFLVIIAYALTFNLLSAMHQHINKSCMHDKKLLFIDTGFNDEYLFNSIFTFAHSVGFQTTFKPFYSVQKNDISITDTIFITIDGSFLKNYLEARLRKASITHPLLQRIFAIATAIAQERNKTITILLPDVGISNNALNVLLLEELCRVFQITQENNEAIIKPAMSIFLYELLQTDNTKSSSYNTALLHTRDGKEVTSTNLEIIDDQIDNAIILKTVPSFTENPLIKTYPLALYIKNNRTNNQFFITKTSLLTFADIKESFTYNPLDYSLRTILLAQVQKFLYEIHQATSLRSLPQETKKTLILPSIFTKKNENLLKNRWRSHRNKSTDQAKYLWINNEDIWCGWGGLEPYFKKEVQATENLFKSGVNLLWFELNPEWYLSENALKKDEKTKFLDSIERFNKAFDQTKKSHEHSTPAHIFIGTDITSNYATAKVLHPVRDVYGTEYSKIPSPFDFENFWQKELLDVYTHFKSSWKDIHNNVTIDGIFLDFEMYHAQTQSGQYTNTMDFSDYTMQKYAQTKNVPCLLALPFEEKIGYLLDNHKFDDYFAFLKREACIVGRKIKEYFNQEFPQALLATYNIHLPHSWFYLGIFAGLSSPQEPIILATFNNEFYRHYEWLQDQHIFSYHMPVVLFSKFQKKQDFDLIATFAQTHDGIWFNRISRLEEPRDPKAWKWDFGLETSPLPTAFVVKEMKDQIKKVQKNLNKNI